MNCSICQKSINKIADFPKRTGKTIQEWIDYFGDSDVGIEDEMNNFPLEKYYYHGKCFWKKKLKNEL